MLLIFVFFVVEFLNQMIRKTKEIASFMFVEPIFSNNLLL